MAGSGKDPLIATVAVNLPIWFGKYKAASREAEFRFASARNARFDLENRLRAELAEALYQYRDAGRRAELYRESLLPLAEQSLDVTLQAFTSGRVEILDLIDAERMLLDLRLSEARAHADRMQSMARLEKLVGRELG
jgi:outer membrane protein TolC